MFFQIQTNVKITPNNTIIRLYLTKKITEAYLNREKKGKNVIKTKNKRRKTTKL